MSNRVIRVEAPAKINLFLGVGERGDDGYHHVDSVMHAIDLCDMVTLEVTDAPQDAAAELDFSCDTDLGIDASDNLACKAAYLLAENLDRSLIQPGQAMKLTLEKHIPAKAGLGGGSSDAAAVLVALCELWGLEPDDERVVATARQLGSDVPFFLRDGCQYLTGRGDVLSETFEPLNFHLMLLKGTKAEVPTAQAYRYFDENPVPVDGLCDMLRALRDRQNARRRRHNVMAALFNNLEEAASSISPEVKELLGFWRFVPLFTAALLCGSGAAVFVVVDSEELGQGVSNGWSGEGFDVWLTHTRPWGARVVS